MPWLHFVLPAILSGIVAFTITPIITSFFISKGWVEHPRSKQQKTRNYTALNPVPRGGGIPIFLGLLVAILFTIPLDKHLLGITIAALLTTMVGVWDDIKDISPKLRLFTNILAALIVVGSGIGIASVSNPFGGVINMASPSINFNFLGSHSIWIVSDLLAIIWIVWCMNIVGWSTGVDGQLPGFVSVSAIFIGVLGLKYSSDITQWPVVVLAGAVAGAYLGFFPFNFFPQKIQPGYSGKSLAGLLLAVLAILSGAKLGTMILLLGLPMVDAVYVFLKRIIQGRSPLKGGPDHHHHQLLKIGLSRRQISIIYLLSSFILGIATLFLNSQQKAYAIIGIILIFTSFVLAISRRT